MKRNEIEYLYVPRRSGGVKLRTTGTKDKTVVRGMKRMLAELKDGPRWNLLDAVTLGDLSLGELYDAHSANTLTALESSMRAEALAPLVESYLATRRANGLASRIIENLTRQLGSFPAYSSQTAGTPELRQSRPICSRDV
jgi:hypothetical protein